MPSLYDEIFREYEPGGQKCEVCHLNVSSRDFKRCSSCAKVAPASTYWRPIIVRPTREECSFCKAIAGVTQVGSDGARTGLNACDRCAASRGISVRVSAAA